MDRFPHAKKELKRSPQGVWNLARRCLVEAGGERGFEFVHRRWRKVAHVQVADARTLNDASLIEEPFAQAW